MNTKIFFENWIKNEPKTANEKYLFIVPSQELAEAIIITGFRAIHIAKEGITDAFSVNSFNEFLESIQFKGKYETDLNYILCLTRKTNEQMKENLKKLGLRNIEGWQLFKNKEYLANYEKQEELLEVLQGFINRYDGSPKNELTELSSDYVKEKLAYNISYDNQGNVKGSKILQTVNNFEIVLENDARFQGKIRFDDFSRQTFLVGSVPWEDGERNYRPWGTFDDSALFSILQADYGLTNRQDFYDAIKNVSMRCRFHPIKQKLDALVWDKREHIRKLLPNYLGVEDTEYNYQVFKLWMIGAVARIYKPGCKFDYTMILQGAQGLGKSTFLKFLALDDAWFNDSLDSLDSDKSAQALMGSWIIELAELKSLARTAGGVDSVKRFLSATQDKYRIPYERRSDVFLRQCVFAGTTNKSDFLQDETGNRRFLIIYTGTSKPKKDLFSKEAMEDIKNAWAQAVYIWKNEKPELVLPEAQRAEAEEIQKQSTADDGKIGMIEEYLKTKSKTCAVEIWQEALEEQGRPQKWQATEINDIMSQMPGWVKMKSPSNFGKYGTQRGFKKVCSTKNATECSKTEENGAKFAEIKEEELDLIPFL